MCQQASLSIYNHVSNGFILPESNHATTYLPPQPWLITVTNTFVSMCGQILLPCGVIHTNTNCRSLAYEIHALAFQRYCPLSLHTTTVPTTSTADNTTTNTTLPNNITSTTTTATASNTKNNMKNNKDRNNKNHPFYGMDSNSNDSNVTVTKCYLKAPFDRYIYHYNRVFVVAQVDDTFIYHIHIEILPRIIYHLSFLLQYPDIKLLVGCDIKNSIKATNKGLRQGLQALQPMLKFIGISPKRLIIHRHVYANEIYLPMEGACQDPVYNTWQLLYMRDYIFKRLMIYDEDHANAKTTSAITTSNNSTSISSRDNNNSRNYYHDHQHRTHPYHHHHHHLHDKKDFKKPIMLLLKRSSNSRHTRNGHDLVRQWNNEFTNILMNELQQTFMNHYDIQLYSDRNESMMNCFECQIKIFHQAKVLIGVHGAGLSYMLYMNPNSAVVELAPYPNDGRCLLGGKMR